MDGGALITVYLLPHRLRAAAREATRRRKKKRVCDGMGEN